MAIEIAVKQKGFFKKKITLSMIKYLLDSNTLLGERDSNSAYVFYELDSDNIDDINIVVQNPNHLGRGFMVRKKSKDIEAFLNVPCTNQDVLDFFDFISKVCTLFKTDYFTMDLERQVKLEELPTLTQDISDWNNDYLYQQVQDLQNQECTFVVFAVKNPIHIPANILTQWSQENITDLERTFSTYLHNKQKEDLYYMKPSFFQKGDKIRGAYSLTETVDSIIPKKAFIPPVTSGLPEGLIPNEWTVGLVRFKGKTDADIDHLPYEVFLDKISYLELEEYDDLHWILRNPTKEFLEGVLK